MKTSKFNHNFFCQVLLFSISLWIALPYAVAQEPTPITLAYQGTLLDQGDDPFEGEKTIIFYTNNILWICTGRIFIGTFNYEIDNFI